jgi:hypothetical protein
MKPGRSNGNPVELASPTSRPAPRFQRRYGNTRGGTIVPLVMLRLSWLALFVATVGHADPLPMRDVPGPGPRPASVERARDGASAARLVRAMSAKMGGHAAELEYRCPRRGCAATFHKRILSTIEARRYEVAP